MQLLTSYVVRRRLLLALTNQEEEDKDLLFLFCWSVGMRMDDRMTGEREEEEEETGDEEKGDGEEGGGSALCMPRGEAVASQCDGGGERRHPLPPAGKRHKSAEEILNLERVAHSENHFK
ncbi:hypothetical protein niasHT_039553 [Heterodera trifolii]|uniref:Uncharacterized protein n=1 Tax=Heterodera trifolii TaxID=157864 RepID=A0ABD2I0C4_9BILA